MTIILHKHQETLRALGWNFFHFAEENAPLEAISGQQNIIAADMSGQYESSLEPAILEALQFVTSLLTKTMLQHVFFNIKNRVGSWENYFPLSFTPPPPTLFPNAIVLFLKSSFVPIVFASSWQLTHLSPTVLQKTSWSCSPKHCPDVSTKLKHICNDSFRLRVKLFLKQWQPHQSDFRFIYQKNESSATSPKVLGCTLVKTWRKLV